MNAIAQSEAARIGAMYGFTGDEVLEHRRSKSLDEARAITAWVLRQRFGFSYPELGKFLGRDHTSIISAVKRVERELRERPESLFALTASVALAKGLAKVAAAE